MDTHDTASPVPKGLELSRVDRRFNVRNTMDRPITYTLNNSHNHGYPCYDRGKTYSHCGKSAPFVRSLTHPSTVVHRSQADGG